MHDPLAIQGCANRRSRKADQYLSCRRHFLSSPRVCGAIAFMFDYHIFGDRRPRLIARVFLATVFICFAWSVILLVSMVWEACVLWKDAKWANERSKEVSGILNQHLCDTDVRMLRNAEFQHSHCPSRHLQTDV